MLSLLNRVRTRRSPFNIAPQRKLLNQENQLLQSPFDQLPPELVLEIVDWLPTSSVAILGLRNRRLFILLGRSSLAVLGAGNASSRALFWKGIGRDLIDTFFCDSCERLHFLKQNCRRKKTTERRFARTPRSRPTVEKERYLQRYEHFTFEHVQVAMKLYRHNLTLDGDMYLNSALLTRPKVRATSMFPSTWAFKPFEASHIQDRICVRTQDWMFTLKSKGFVLSHDLQHIGREHMDYWLSRKSLNNLLRCKLGHLSVGEEFCFDCSNLIRCSVCFTEIQADIQTVAYDPDILLMITTMWQYLTEDVPLEAARRRRCYRFEEKLERFDFDRVPQNVLLQNPSDCAPTGTIWDAFEQQTTTPFDSILSVEQAWEAVSRWAKKPMNLNEALTTRKNSELKI